MSSIARTQNFATQPHLPFALVEASPERRVDSTPCCSATTEARELAHEKIKSKRSKRYCLILLALDKHGSMTARQVLRILIKQGDLPPSAERNQVSPRLTELSKAGCVETLEELRQIGIDDPASAWCITKRGRLYLLQTGGREAEQ